MKKNKYNRILKHSFLLLIYATIFFLILFNLPKYTYAQDKDKNLEISVDVKEEKKEDKIEDSKNLDSISINFNEELISPNQEPDKILFKINQSLQKSLNIKKDKITKILGININSIEDLINMEKIIENYNIIAIIDLDEIINASSEKNLNEDIENTATKKAPEFIINFWNKFKEIVASYN